VHSRQKLIAIAEMVFAKLTGRVTERLERLGNGYVLCVEADVGSRKADLGQAGANWRLSRDECGASSGATLLGVIVVNIPPSLPMRSMFGVR
jgi:hypothetical protein